MPGCRLGVACARLGSRVALGLLLIPGAAIRLAGQTVTLEDTADTTLKATAPNKNLGAQPSLVLREGGSRIIVRFDSAAIATAVGSGSLASAQLQLYIGTNAANWGPTGRTVDIYRLDADWTERGATWNCANDTDPANDVADCAARWNGGTIEDDATDTVVLTNASSGWIQFDVTADVQAFLAGTANDGWLLQKTDEGQAGRVDLASRKGTAPPGPRLVLVSESATVDTVPPSLAIVAPAQAVLVNLPSPQIAVVYRDGGSGVDTSTLHVLLDGHDLTTVCALGAQSATCTTPPLAAGPHSVTASLSDHAGNAATATRRFQLFIGPSVQTLTFPAAADAYITGHAPNREHGRAPILRVAKSGPSRSLVQFDSQPLSSALAGSQLLSAQLELSIAANGHNWGAHGRTVGAYRLTSSWSEAAATWHCPEDTNLRNDQPDCAVRWDGGAFVSTPTATVLHSRNLAGAVDFDVTSDVAAFLAGTPNDGWLLKKAEEDESGRVDYVSRVASSGEAARLVVVFQVPSTDTSPPTLAILSPSQPLIYNTLPTIAVSYSDPESGVDTSSLAIAVDGTPLADCTVGAAGATCPAPALAAGAHVVRAQVKDRAGNQATASFSFQLATDTTPPVVTISSPTDGGVLASSHPTVAATYSDADSSVDPSSIRLTLDAADVTAQAQVTATGLTFTPASPLADGSHVAAIAVHDLGGNAAHAAVHFSTDTAPPTVVITSPAEGSILASPTPSLQATFSDATSGVDPASAHVTVDGLDRTLEAQASATALTWTAQLPLAAGSHTAVISVSDLAGNAAQASRNFAVTIGTPTLVVTSPMQLFLVDQPTPQIAVVYADVGAALILASLRVAVDGSDITSTCVVGPAAASCSTPSLFDGQHTVSQHLVTARIGDAAGAVATAQFGFLLTMGAGDVATPVVAITSPAPGSMVNTPLATIAGTVTDDGIVQITVNDQPTPLTASAFSAQVQLQEGLNQIRVAATDLVGHRGTAIFGLVLDSTPPALAILSPAPGYVTNADSVAVTGLASDALSGLATVTVGGIPAALTGTSFAARVPLVEGPNTVTVTAFDRAGNAQSATVAVERLTLPVVTITSPADLSTLAATTVDVQGTVSTPAAAVAVNGVAAAVAGASFVAHGVPLIEGGNIVTATVTDAHGHVGTATVTIVRDLTPPHVVIYWPPEGAVIADPTVDVVGLVNDVVAGTVNAAQATVTVNGRPAAVANRSFAVQGVPLIGGDNTIQATATDASGNVAQTSVTVRLQTTGARLVKTGGNLQSGMIGSLLPQPLGVQLLDATGAPVAARYVLFEVKDGDGTLDGGRRHLPVLTDAGGRAAVHFTLGTRAGIGNQRVEASAAGFLGPEAFTFTALPGSPALIVVDAGDQQVGVAGQSLPRPLVVAVTDAGFNRLADIAVGFTVAQGGGQFVGGVQALTLTADGDGRVIVPFTLGPEEGVANNAVEARIVSLAQSPVVTFKATAKFASEPAQTSISGVVLDNSNHPVAGVTLRLRGSLLTAVTDAAGVFHLAGVPVGTLQLIVDGSTATSPGAWPDLEFTLTTIAGRDNTVGMPILLLPLDLAHGIQMDETHGGTVTLPALPGFALVIAPGSVTFPGGGRSGVVSVTVVHGDKVPMVPNFGQQPRLIVTIQPPGALFNPPARLTMPNVEGLAPGSVTEFYSFDHDLGHFVSIGPGTVSEDGSVVVSNPGVGILKGGWHCDGNPSPSGTADDCGYCKICFNGECVNDDFRPPPDLVPHDCMSNICIGGKAFLVEDRGDLPIDRPNDCHKNLCGPFPDNYIPDLNDHPPGWLCCQSTANFIDPYDPARQCCTADGPAPKFPPLRDTAQCSSRIPAGGPPQLDGCSVPALLTAAMFLSPILLYSGNPNNPAGGNFTQFSNLQNLPCDDHDRCYQTCNSDRSDCDDKLGAAMLAVCDAATDDGPFIQALCREWGLRYYRALQLTGHFAWAADQRLHCQCCP